MVEQSQFLRLFEVAAEKGDRLELAGGQLPVLWSGGNSVRGQRPVSGEELEALLDSLVPAHKLITFELGEEVRCFAGGG